MYNNMRGFPGLFQITFRWQLGNLTFRNAWINMINKTTATANNTQIERSEIKISEARTSLNRKSMLEIVIARLKQ